MSRLKLSSNLFLEVRELEKFKEFLKEDGYARIIKSLVSRPGIVKNASNTYFKVTQKLDLTNNIVVNEGLAFDSNLEAIVSDSAVVRPIVDTTKKWWVILSRAVSNYEQGTVNISPNGVLTGAGTSFTKVLRGQPNFPTKIRLNSATNNKDYEVVSVNSDDSAVVAGNFNAEAENGLKYSVIGTFTPGFLVNENDKCIYEYDSSYISIIDSDTVPSVADDNFILASIEFVNNKMVITDKRQDYMFNYENKESYFSTNPLTSLLRMERTEDKRIELVLEHGFSISTYSLTVTASDNKFTITSGGCNFLGDLTTTNSVPSYVIPTGMFNGWTLLNRKNMESVIIDNNVGNDLFVSIMNDALIESANNDFVILPGCSEIEYQIKFLKRNSVDPTIWGKSDYSIYKRLSAQNIFNRLDIPVRYGETEIELSYRMINERNDQKTKFNPLAIAQFDNIISGLKETLSGSSFIINVVTPIELQRNYS